MMYRLLFLLMPGLAACSPKKLYVQDKKPQLYTIRKEDVGDSAVAALLQPYRQGVDTLMHGVIGYTDIPLTKAQPESTLGNFMADAMLAAARRIDPSVLAAISNYGGIRLSYIAPGPISRNTLYELMPFENKMAILEIPGSVLQQFCDVMAARKGWPLSGISFLIKDRLSSDILIGGRPLHRHLVYRIVVSDYLARGGDQCDFLRPLQKRVTEVLIRDALIEYVAALQREGKPLHPVLQNRIRYTE